MRFKHLALAGVVSALLSAAVNVSAASIIGDAFEASLTIESTTYGPFSGVADSNAGTNNFFSGNGGLNDELSVRWVDDDSVDVAFFVGGLSSNLEDASFTLSGLNFCPTVNHGTSSASRSTVLRVTWMNLSRDFPSSAPI